MGTKPGVVSQSLAKLFKRWGLVAVADLRTMRRRRGAYLLLLVVPASRINVGARGSLRFAEGLYAYVGSACGRSMTIGHRLARHMRRKKVPRWHIDYLTTHPAVAVQGAYWSMDPAVNERRLALRCAERFPAIPRFGNTDAGGGTPGHLFFILPPRS